VIRRWAATAALVTTLLAPAAAEARSAQLTTGFLDSAVLAADQRDVWLPRMAQAGASTVRINVFWDQIAPAAATPGPQDDPAWAAYDFARLDGEVVATVAAGLRPILNVSRAPVWAEGPGRPRDARAGTWKPDAAAFGRFVSALARRYAGTFVNPAGGRPLPRVTAFQLWNEPNLDTYLGPQWEGGKPFAPGRFRALVNAGHRAVKAVQPRATVVAAGLAPFGDHRTTSGKRMPPVSFLRGVLCVDARGRRTCRDRTSVDVVAHHPYAVRKPSSPALNATDATIPDLGKITDVVGAARRARTIGPRTPKLWVTEVSYDSAPPDPRGVPTARLSRWTAELLWRLWDQGAESVIWLQVRDARPIPSFAASYQSGMFLHDGAIKPSAQAFRFPLVVTARRGDRLAVWWRAPRAGRVRVQVRRGGRWATVRRATARTGGVGRTTVPAARTSGVRAVIDGEASYAWTGSPAPRVRR
jgi:hypothetical protein